MISMWYSVVFMWYSVQQTLASGIYRKCCTVTCLCMLFPVHVVFCARDIGFWHILEMLLCNVSCGSEKQVADSWDLPYCRCLERVIPCSIWGSDQGLLGPADTFHKPGFKMHAKILHHMFGILGTDVIKAPLWDTAAMPISAFPSNAAFVHTHVSKLLTVSFPNMQASQVEVCPPRLPRSQGFESHYLLRSRFKGLTRGVPAGHHVRQSVEDVPGCILVLLPSPSGPGRLLV
jgi:hypothetical protein